MHRTSSEEQRCKHNQLPPAQQDCHVKCMVIRFVDSVAEHFERADNGQ